MTTNAEDEVRGSERIARLIGRYGERFDSPSRAEFYASLAARLGRMRDDENEFILRLEMKKPSQGQNADGSLRKTA